MSAPAHDGPTCAPPGAAPGLAYTLTALAFLAHNVEELLGLPDWAGAQAIVEIHRPGFANALAWVTLMALAILLIGRTMQFAIPAQRLVAVLAGALAFNVATHVLGSLATMSYMPGLGTAFALILPSVAWLMARLPLARREKLIAGLAGALAMPLVAFAALRLAGAIAATP
ncbi:MAG: HXXEE domain-containing protein [Maritimibacter sp.]|nr:HXXEE domain-containing protein [Maritimibacter sp.]